MSILSPLEILSVGVTTERFARLAWLALAGLCLPGLAGLCLAGLGLAGLACLGLLGLPCLALPWLALLQYHQIGAIQIRLPNLESCKGSDR